MSSRGVSTLRTLIAVATTTIGVAGWLVLDHLSNTQDAAAARPQLADLQYISEAMLVDESTVPPLEGTTWGRMVAVPRGAPPPVNPPQCALFLSQGDALQKGLAMRSSRGAAIGVELAIVEHRVDLAAVRDDCDSFTLDAPGLQSRVRVEPTCLARLADGAISTKIHSETTTAEGSVSWEIAMITGYHRGVLVTAEYTPGPHGSAFNDELASTLVPLFRAQIARLDAI